MKSLLTKVVLCATQEEQPPAVEPPGNVLSDTQSQEELKGTAEGSATAGGERNGLFVCCTSRPTDLSTLYGYTYKFGSSLQKGLSPGAPIV